MGPSRDESGDRQRGTASSREPESRRAGTNSAEAERPSAELRRPGPPLPPSRQSGGPKRPGVSARPDATAATPPRGGTRLRGPRPSEPGPRLRRRPTAAPSAAPVSRLRPRPCPRTPRPRHHRHARGAYVLRHFRDASDFRGLDGVGRKDCGDDAWDLGTASVCHSREVAVSLVIPYSVLSSSACTSLRATGGLRTVMARNGTSKSKRKPWSRRHFPARKEGGLQKKIKTHLSPCEELAGTR